MSKDSNETDNKNSKSSNLIKPLYTKNEVFRCLFCGGRNCKNEDYTKHPTNNPILKGLNSDLVDENIIASQRPSNTLIENFNLIKQFQDINIGLIINLQIPGEHPNCGPNDLDFEGYSYSPSKFVIEEIDVECCGWKDMGVPDLLEFVLQIVKKMHFYITKLKKKVLVHCHSGYGRTGLIIACYKIFSEGVNADLVIKEIRGKRKKCVQNSSQYEFCEHFYEFIRRKRNIFDMEKKNIDIFINEQELLDTDDYKFDNFIFEKTVPLILQYSFDAILNIKYKNNVSVSSIFKAFNGSIEINEKLNYYLKPIIESINHGKWNIFNACDDIIIIIELIYLWLGKHVNFCINPNKVSHLGNESNKSLSHYELKIIYLITSFINMLLLDEKKNNKYTNDMIGKISIYLLGYTIDNLKKERNQKKMENVEKLFKLINETLLYYESNENNFLYKKIQENKNEKNEKKDEIIQSIFNHYFKGNISMKKKKDIENSIEEIIKGNYENESKISKSDKIHNDIPFKVNKIGSISLKKNNKFPSNNDSSDLRSIKTLELGFINQYKEEKKDEEEKKGEEEEGKKIPWIKEEDC